MLADLDRTAQRPPDLSHLVCRAIRDGDLVEAEQMMRMQLLSIPKDVCVIAKLADLLIAQDKTSEAIAHLHQGLALAPAADQFRLQLIHLYQQRGHFSTALRLLEELPAPIRGTDTVRVQEAALLGQIGRRDQEVLIYREVLRKHSRNERLWLNLGIALNYSGRPREAVLALRRAIKVAPLSGEPWWTLANLKSFRFSDRDINAMRHTLRQDIEREDAVHVHFALGRAFEERENYSQSFYHYCEGNRLRASEYRPEQMRVTEFVDKAIATFNRPFFDHYRGSGCPARDPIFIIGLQRSGSTLIEQMLASHPQIEGTTELLAMQQLWDETARLGARNGRNIFQQLADFRPRDYRRIGEEYLERAKPFRQLGRPFFVDKLPANWLQVGLIRLALPNAKIIDARRHPMACGFSNFKQLYAHGVTYAFSQPSIGLFYRDYLRMMDHFDKVQPGAIHHVVNERLIENPEGELRSLFDYLEIPFNPASLDFHQNQRAVHTPSAEQVRRPINRDGVDAWRPYAPWLNHLVEALGPALDEWLPKRL